MEPLKYTVRHVPLPEGGSRRASHFEVRFDGGAFTLHVNEFRERAEPREGPVALEWDMVEVARFSVSPVALRYLSTAVEGAVSTYRQATGHDMPDPVKVQEVLNRIIQQQPIAEPPPRKK